MRLAVLLLLVATTAAASTDQLLSTVQVRRKGAAEICLAGTKRSGAALSFRVEVWRGKALVGSAEVPDRDRRAVFAQCRTFSAPAVFGDTVKVYSTATARPVLLTVNPRPGGVPD